EKNNLDLLHHEFLSNRNNRARRSSSRVKQPLPPEQNPYRQITTCSIYGDGITSHGLVQQSVPDRSVPSAEMRQGPSVPLLPAGFSPR
ncbi:MAG: hypothetical protein LBR88_05740, partial [Zoogloeaceae bacterium]|nr:hypothetical protein [Zoogloeaceae bacterium]